ncbi:MAG TPA: PIN domain-containing protein [Dehalococcoidia bacterium]|nr:PIN domain-containing protein [Dehalococcoidia bacterium]
MNSEIYLLDTSAWVLALRRQPPLPVANRIRTLLDANAIAVNQVVRLELLVGCRTEKEYTALDDRLAGLVQLPILGPTWERAARIGFDLRRKGITASVPDLIISACAVENSAVLMHADADFDRIAESSDLRTESHAGAGA